MCCASASARCWRVSEPVTGPLSDLTAALRAEGMRVGVGELLNAHRALAAIDSASREDARLALRAILCSSHADLERFERAFLAAFGDERPPGRPQGFDDVAVITQPATPHAAIPGMSDAVAADPEREPVPAA